MEPRPDYGEQSYQGHGRLSGKAALITGGDSGIGRAVALACAREGADVLTSYLNEDVDAQETLRAVEAAGRTGIAVAGAIAGRPGRAWSAGRITAAGGRRRPRPARAPPAGHGAAGRSAPPPTATRSATPGAAGRGSEPTRRRSAPPRPRTR
jgi:hypothetical protein